MTEPKSDFQRLAAQKHYLKEVEYAIRVANCEIIHKRIPMLNKDTIVSFAVTVGRLRARYLEAAFKLGVNEHGDTPKREEIDELRLRREMFEEARTAFAALQHAIEMGYVDVEGVSEASCPR